jgi:hypothetical protein
MTRRRPHVQEVSFYIAELYAAAGGGVKTAEVAGKADCHCRPRMLASMQLKFHVRRWRRNAERIPATRRKTRTAAPRLLSARSTPGGRVRFRAIALRLRDAGMGAETSNCIALSSRGCHSVVTLRRAPLQTPGHVESRIQSVELQIGKSTLPGSGDIALREKVPQRLIEGLGRFNVGEMGRG